jgi:hypothetical protein
MGALPTGRSWARSTTCIGVDDVPTADESSDTCARFYDFLRRPWWPQENQNGVFTI